MLLLRHRHGTIQLVDLPRPNDHDRPNNKTCAKTMTIPVIVVMMIISWAHSGTGTSQSMLPRCFDFQSPEGGRR